MSYPITLQEFDKEDPKNVGRPFYFDVDKYLSCVEEMIASDEVERALWMLNNMPGWYRDNYPSQAKSIRDQLYRRLYTTVDYIDFKFHPGEMNDLIEMDKNTFNKHLMHYLGRASLILQLVEKLNKDGIRPHIHEVAPGSYWLPIGLEKNECEFTYYGLGLNHEQNQLIESKVKCWSLLKAHHNIFVCYELIEHLYAPQEIYQHYLKANQEFTHILLSTPKYSVRSANPNWYNADLGHLRTYTPREFIDFAVKHWPDFKWTMYDGDVMVLMGEKTCL